MNSKSRIKRRMAVGYGIFGGLVAIKVVEYFAGRNMHSAGWTVLAVLAVLATWLILYYFMHVTQLRSGRRDRE